MNKDRRRRLGMAESFISEARSIIETVRDEEEEAIANIPENFESGDQVEAMEEAVGNLESAITALEEAEEAVSEAKG